MNQRLPAFVIETTYDGETVFVTTSISADLRLSVGFVVDPANADTFDTEQKAQRWATKVTRVDPTLTVRVVPDPQ